MDSRLRAIAVTGGTSPPSRSHRGDQTGERARGLHVAARRGTDVPPPRAPVPTVGCADAHQKQCPHTRGASKVRGPAMDGTVDLPPGPVRTDPSTRKAKP